MPCSRIVRSDPVRSAAARSILPLLMALVGRTTNNTGRTDEQRSRASRAIGEILQTSRKQSVGRWSPASPDYELLLLAAPAALLVIVFFLVPLVNIFVLSVTEPK